MISIFKEIKGGFKELFPGGKFRYVLVILSILAAIISVSELLVMKFFVNIVVKEGDIEAKQFILLGAGMALFFVLTRFSQYYQRLYRVKAFARSFKALKKIKNRGAKNPEWQMAFEVSNLLTQATQLIAVLVFILIIEPIYAALNLVVLIVVLTVIGKIFINHLKEQEALQGLVDGKQARPQKRHSARIKAGESGALWASSGIVLLLVALLFFSYTGKISLSNTLIIFFGTRLQNGSLSNSSRSLMRYARAKVGASNLDEDDE